MIETLQAIIRGALERLSQQTTADLPPLIAAAVIMITAWLFACLARWLVTRIFKGIEIDQWLRRSGVAGMIDRSGRLRTSRVAAKGAYWAVLFIGFLTALNAFGTEFTSRLAAGIALLLPRIIGALLIVLAGLWLGQYLGRGVLVWAVNEDLPSPRKLALSVRVFIAFAAAAIAADTVDFGREVFLSAFVILMGGLVLAAALAVGIGGRDAVRRYFESRAAGRHSEEQYRSEERSLWHHL